MVIDTKPTGKQLQPNYRPRDPMVIIALTTLMFSLSIFNKFSQIYLS